MTKNEVTHEWLKMMRQVLGPQKYEEFIKGSKPATLHATQNNKRYQFDKTDVIEDAEFETIANT